MFFPSSSEIVKQRFSYKEDEKNTKTDVDWSWTAITKTSLSKANIKSKANINSGSNPKEPKTQTIEIVVGKSLRCGVERFLSNNGKTTHLVRFKKGVPQKKPVEFDRLSGKYLLICCFDVPMPSDSFIAMKCRALIAAYHELSELGYPFEMVVVANMRTDVVYDPKAAFYHFYSAFSCFAIPFSDFETRDYINSCMSRSYNTHHDLAMLVNPDGVILQDDEAFYHFLYYGSEWAPPFLPTTLDAIEKQDEVLRSKLDPMYLAEAFLSRYSKFAIDTVEVRQQPPSLYRDVLLDHPRLTLQALPHKYVGLYLFIDGEIIEDIKAAHDHCLANNLPLEIVLLPMPFFDEPESHMEQLRQALRSLKIKSWLLYNIDTKARRRLWRIYGRGHACLKEKLIIIPPDFSKTGELYGREAIINLGFNEYPFTRTAILQRRLEYVRSLTPVFPSLFNNCLMIQNGQEFKSEQLQGKNVLLYLTWSQCDGYKLVKKHYPDIKAMGSEVVFVLLDYTESYWNKEWVDPGFCQNCPCLNLKEIPCPFMLLPPEARLEIKAKLFFPEDLQTTYLFAVAKDGKIVSRDVQHQLDTDGATQSLFDDVLEADLACGLADIPLLDDYN